MTATIATIAIVAAALTRLLKAAEPLWNQIPERFRWLPPVVLGIAGTVAAVAIKPGAAWIELGEAALTGLATGLAAIGGREALLRVSGARTQAPAEPLQPEKKNDDPPLSTTLTTIALMIAMSSACFTLSACGAVFQQQEAAHSAIRATCEACKKIAPACSLHESVHGSAEPSASASASLVPAPAASSGM